MAEDSSQSYDEHNKHQNHSTGEHTDAGIEAQSAPGIPAASYSPALLQSTHINGRGNSPVRTAAIQQLQRTHGNRAVQRLLQGTTSSVAVQREPPTAAGAGAAAPAGATSSGQSNPGGPANLEGATVHIAGGVVTIDSSMVRVNGALSADTLIANSVVASSYTPGAGNVM